MQLGTPLNQAAAMLKLSGQSDPDPQRYLRNTHIHTQTDRQTEIPCFYKEMLEIFYLCGFITLNAADFFYVCGLLRLRTLLHCRALHTVKQEKDKLHFFNSY